MKFSEDDRPGLIVGHAAAPQCGAAAGGIEAPGSLSPSEAFDRYAREVRRTPATDKRWRAVAAKLQDEHQRMADITHEWCIEWVDRLTASGLSRNTIRNVYLASLRVVCRWAVANGALTADPTDGVIVSIPKPIATRSKDFSD